MFVIGYAPTLTVQSNVLFDGLYIWELKINRKNQLSNHCRRIVVPNLAAKTNDDGDHISLHLLCHCLSRIIDNRTKILRIRYQCLIVQCSSQLSSIIKGIQNVSTSIQCKNTIERTLYIISYRKKNVIVKVQVNRAHIYIILYVQRCSKI